VDGENPPGHYVIVYDTLEKRIYMESPDSIQSSSKKNTRLWSITKGEVEKKYVKVEAPGTKMMIDLRAPVGPKDNQVQMKVGTINISSLGKSARKQRQNGNIKHVYILGQLPGGFGNIDEMTES